MCGLPVSVSAPVSLSVCVFLSHTYIGSLCQGLPGTFLFENIQSVCADVFTIFLGPRQYRMAST
eukprot:m.158066 g.158066  ORF g.158066 m.158066 type:complete len:64 (+) comp24741_c0_seq8:471-662(+)